MDNKNIGDTNVLTSVLSEAGFDAKTLLQKAEAAEVKETLRKNTQRAKDAGVCGVPSFQVNGGDVIWGQDRLDVVSDILCGWKSGNQVKIPSMESKL